MLRSLRESVALTIARAAVINRIPRRAAIPLRYLAVNDWSRITNGITASRAVNWSREIWGLACTDRHRRCLYSRVPWHPADAADPAERRSGGAHGFGDPIGISDPARAGARPDPNPDSAPEPNTQAGDHALSYPATAAEHFPHADANARPHTNPHTGTDAYTRTHANAHTRTDANPDAGTDTNPHAGTDANTHAGTDAYPNPATATTGWHGDPCLRQPFHQRGRYANSSLRREPFRL